MLEVLTLDSALCDDVQVLDPFCGQASRLRDVTLHRIAVRWDSDVLVGLRSLSITERLEYLPTEGLIRRLLAANPGLESMDVEAWGEPDTEHFGEDAIQSTSEGRPSRVVLSKMQELRLFNLPFELVQAVLGNIEIPSIRSLELRCLFRGLPASRMLGSNFKHLVPTLLQLSKGAQQVQLTFGESSVGLAIYTPHHEIPPIQIQLKETMPISGFDWLAESFFHAEGLPSVCAAEIFQGSLTFHDGFDMARGTFIPILDRLNAIKVKALNIEDGSRHGKELINYLGQAKGDSQWPLPYLTSMRIGGSAKLADHLSIALQRRMLSAPAREAPEVPRPVMPEVLDIRGLRGVDKVVERALAKCVASSGTFIPGRPKWRLRLLSRLNHDFFGFGVSSDEDI